MYLIIAFFEGKEICRTATQSDSTLPERLLPFLDDEARDEGLKLDRADVHAVDERTEVIDADPRISFVKEAGSWFPAARPAPAGPPPVRAIAKAPPKPKKPKKASAVGCAECGNAGFIETASGLHGCPDRCIYAANKLTACLRAIDEFVKRIKA